MNWLVLLIPLIVPDDMKHVFVINSHTTFLTSMGVVDYLKIPSNDVIFLYVRNYKNSVSQNPFAVFECTDLANSCNNITDKYLEKIANIDAFIAKNIKCKYSLYVPHLWHWFHQILYTNNLCKKVSYVQEGGPAQTKVYIKDVSWIESVKSYIRLAILKHRIFECKWYIKGCIYKQRQLDSYAINDMYFDCLPSVNHVVEWPRIHIDVQLDSKRPIFIFDGHIENGTVEPDIYFQACSRIIRKYAYPENYVKFHPAQGNDERRKILDMFLEDGHRAEVMSDEIPVEYIILQFRKLTFIGFTSSLLYYAQDNHHNVICCEDELILHSTKYRKHIEECGFMTLRKTYKNGAKFSESI